jgi:hypothetical protein
MCFKDMNLNLKKSVPNMCSFSESIWKSTGFLEQEAFDVVYFLGVGKHLKDSACHLMGLSFTHSFMLERGGTS